MNETPEFGAYHTRPPWLWLLLILAGALTLIMGSWGYFLLNETHFVSWSGLILDTAYDVAQLFVLHTPEFGTPPVWQLQVARFSGAFFFFFSLAMALWQIVKMEGRHLVYGWKRGHVIICGAGWRGLTLARDYVNVVGRSKVIVLENNPESRGIAECHRLDIPYFIGDASDPALLSSVAAQAAERVIAVCGNDEVNMEIAVRASQLKRRGEGSLKCSLHLSNDDLRTMVREKGFAQEGDSRIEISTFGTDIYENAARDLFHRTPLDREPIDKDSPLRIHLIIAGFGPMGQAVLKQAACIAHYANILKPRVTVVDRHATEEFEEFVLRHSGINEIADVTVLDRASHAGTLIDLVTEEARDARFLSTCVVCFPEEKFNLALAVKLGDALKGCHIPVRWWLQARSDAGLGLVFSAELEAQLKADNVMPFGSLEEVCTARMIQDDEPAEMGRIIHESYVAEQLKKGETLKDNPNLRPWHEMSESFKYSNRLAADHIVIKMRALGYSIYNEPKTDCITEFSDEQIEILSRMEHARYCAERWMDGWKYGKQKNLIAKTNPTLIPWDHPLPEAERMKDREQVRKIPYILSKAGYSICRSGM